MVSKRHTLKALEMSYNLYQHEGREYGEWRSWNSIFEVIECYLVFEAGKCNLFLLWKIYFHNLPKLYKMSHSYSMQILPLAHFSVLVPQSLASIPEQL